MKCFQNYRVKYEKYVQDPFVRKLSFCMFEVEEVLQFIKSTPCFYEFYNKTENRRFKIKKENVISYTAI